MDQADGVGARLDHQPELLFALRQVDHLDLLSSAESVANVVVEAQDNVMDSSELSAMFGIEIENAALPKKGRIKATKVRGAVKTAASKALRNVRKVRKS